MSNEVYLRSLLAGQVLGDAEVRTLRGLRETIEEQLSRLAGSPRFYYGGSYGKDTMIRAGYDLDIVVYWPADCGYTLEGIFKAVGGVLREHWTYVSPKNVAWTLPFQGGFHVDVVPGRALDASFRYANLFRSQTAQALQTSLKMHIDAVRKGGRRDLVRLLKLWKISRSVPVKSFVLELLGVEGAKAASLVDLEPQLIAALAHIRDRIAAGRIIDPANSGNDLGDTMTATEKAATRHAADQALAARTWPDVFR
jgi:hypothetical protein